MTPRSPALTYGDYLALDDGPAVNFCKPAVDPLVTSAIDIWHGAILSVILTGMGKDGAQGLLKMKEAGAQTIAQDERSCVVFGMPKEAINLGAVDKVVPLAKISQAVIDLL